MNIIVSTDNPNKLKEIQALVGNDYYVMTKSEAGFSHVHPVEDGSTLEENAKIKIKEITAKKDDIVIGDDTGLFVHALNLRPGVYSARYAGEDGNDVKNRKKLLKEMKDKTDRRAYFKTVIAIKQGDVIKTVEGICEGTIIESEKGSGGFGYDPLFVPKGSEKTFAEMSSEEKNEISHRAKALRAFLNFITLEKSI